MFDHETHYKMRDERGNVVLVDPDGVNINYNMVNAIPKYEDMHIFVELIAQRRGRTVIVDSGWGNVGTESTGLEGDVVINMMGVDNREGSPTKGSFTTNWHNETTGNETQYEGFGITNIDITTNSSYIPQVNIEFTDIRGMSFFNEKDSKYRILFDFPPPRFVLTVKGYYGKALTYHMHLVKYTSEFRAENGNFVINAEFIAIMYAPLTDILFRYVINAPLMEDEVGDPDSTTPNKPANTNELILRLRNLYNKIDKRVGTTAENAAYEEARESLEVIQEKFRALVNFSKVEYLAEEGELLLIVEREGDGEENSDFKRIRSFIEYDAIIKNRGVENITNEYDEKLYIGYSGYVVSDKKMEVLEKYARDVLNLSENQYSIDTVVKGVDLLNSEFVESGIFYQVLDITSYYNELYKSRGSAEKRLEDIADTLNDMISDLIIQQLGMVPTIYNIFEIILNDVDKFFNQIRRTSQRAEDLHNENKNIIVPENAFRDVGAGENERLFAFPLVVKREPLNYACGGAVEERRISPIEITRNTGYHFPEMELVDLFIQTFNRQAVEAELNVMRQKEDSDGNLLWVPFSPMDSDYFSDASSPYINSIFLNENQFNAVLSIFLRRYYALSQYALSGSIVGKGNTLFELYAEGEANNLAESLLTQEVVGLVKTNINQFSDLNVFFEYVEKNLPTIYNYNDESIDFNRSNRAYSDKSNENFQGVDIIFLTNGVELRRIDEDADDHGNTPVGQFLNKNEKNWWGRHFGRSGVLDYIEFTKENLFYLPETMGSTIFLEKINYAQFADSPFYKYQGKISLRREAKETTNYQQSMRYRNLEYFEGNPVAVEPNKLIDFFLEGRGNDGFLELTGKELDSFGGANFSLGKKTEPMEQIIRYLSTVVHENDEIYNLIFDKTHPDYDEDLSMLLIISFFGYVISPFNVYPKRLNSFLFTLPGIIQMPRFLVYYLGMLSHFVDEDNESLTTNPKLEKITNFFKNEGLSGNISGAGIFIFADYMDIKNGVISKTDKDKFKRVFNTDIYRGDRFNGLVKSIKQFYDDGLQISQNDEYKTLFNALTELNSKKENYNNEIGNILWKTDTHLLINSSLSFKDIKPDEVQPNIIPLAVNKNNPEIEKFFTTFFAELNKKIKDLEAKNKERRIENDSIGYDEDIRTQTYYSFKNINDKWLSGIGHKTDMGYPLNDIYGKAKLIDSFVFVNRAMAPIGDTILNPEMLLNFMDDPNISVYSALAQLLSVNGFEFFPLQNFMTYERDRADGWVDSFKIDTSGTQNNHPMFVCMYIGGASSYPTGIGRGRNEFKDDGITDLLDPGVSDFSGGCEDSRVDVNDYDNQTQNNTNFPYYDVRAFRVRYGEQNQSMFTDFKIESKEYPETNESLQILSRIAGDLRNQAPIPKGQNLYSLYENRAYKATITSLGNVMIQPTQYFQLENVPLYNGAYIILTVHHNIKPNHMVTDFSGTKILKYPVPRVIDVSTAFGYPGGSKSMPGMEQDERSDAVPVRPLRPSDDEMTWYDSMHTEKIKGFKKITPDGENYIRTAVNRTNRWGDALSGSKGPMPFTNQPPLDKVWTAQPISNNGGVISKAALGNHLIILINKYAEIFNLDANFVAGLIEQESKYILWNFAEPSLNSSASGLSQFVLSTLWETVIRDNGHNFSVEEKNALSKGMVGERNASGYVFEKRYYDVSSKNSNFVVARNNRRNHLHQNIIDNPEIMVKACCVYLHNLAAQYNKKSNNLASVVLFGYNRGPGMIDTDYNRSIVRAINHKPNYEKEGINYVYKIFKLLYNHFGYTHLNMDSPQRPFVTDVVPDGFREDNVSEGFLMWPLPEGVGRITSYRGWRIISGKRQMHRGTDFAAEEGTPIYAIRDGVVYEKLINNDTAGNSISIRHGGGYRTRYLHMSRFEGNIKIGDQVKMGQTIGYVGNTGRSTGPHLCLQLFNGEDKSDHIYYIRPPMT
jgi:hypothetical protein